MLTTTELLFFLFPTVLFYHFQLRNRLTRNQFSFHLFQLLLNPSKQYVRGLPRVSGYVRIEPRVWGLRASAPESGFSRGCPGVSGDTEPAQQSPAAAAASATRAVMLFTSCSYGVAVEVSKIFCSSTLWDQTVFNFPQIVDLTVGY